MAKDDDIGALNKQIDEEPDKEKKAWLEYIRDYALGKKDKNAKIFKEVQEIDKHLRTALTLVLNYYAESEGQFNQKHLDDVALLISKRAERVKRLK